MKYLALLILLLVTGCAEDNSPLQAAVQRYDTLLARGYRTLNMTALTEVASVEQAKKVYHHMAAMAEGRVKMDARLRDLEFLEIDRQQPDSAMVRARETWDYQYINIDNGAIAEESTVTYTLRYHLARKNDRWLVTAIDVDDAVTRNSRGGLPFLQRPSDSRPAKEK